jgi:hypothetical protein
MGTRRDLEAFIATPSRYNGIQPNKGKDGYARKIRPSSKLESVATSVSSALGALHRPRFTHALIFADDAPKTVDAHGGK